MHSLSSVVQRTDVTLLGRDVAADAAIKAGSTLRPDDEQLARVDEPAPTKWIHPDGSTAGAHEEVPDTGIAAQKDRLVEKKDAVVDRAQNEGAPALDRMKDAGAQDQRDANASRSDEQNVPSGDAFAQQAKEEGSRLRNKISDKIPQEHKDLAKEHYGKAKVRCTLSLS